MVVLASVVGLEIVASCSVSWDYICRIILLQGRRYRIFNIYDVNMSVFTKSSCLLCPDVRRAVGTAAAMPPSTRSFFLSGAFLLALWKSWSSGPVKTWPTTVTTQHHIQGRRWSSMQNQVWAALWHGIILDTQSVSIATVSSKLTCIRSVQLKYHVHSLLMMADDWLLTSLGSGCLIRFSMRIKGKYIYWNFI